MSLSPQIIGFVQELLSTKNTMELNLTRMEADQMNAWKKSELKDLSEQLGYKIKPTDFIVAEKLTKVLEKSGLVWENLEKAKQDLLAKMVLREPERDVLQKTPVANALYEKIGENGFWQKDAREQQNQMLNQIADLAHRANSGLDFFVLKDLLDNVQWEWLDMAQKFLQIAQALENVNLIRKIDAIAPFSKVEKPLPASVFAKSVEEIATKAENLEEVRMQKMLTQKEKIDYGARAQLVDQIHTKTSRWKKQKTQDDLIREGYQQAESQAQKHLYETLEKEKKNLKNIHQKQKRFEEEEIEETPQKDRKGLYAGLLTGGAIGGVGFLAYLVS